MTKRISFYESSDAAGRFCVRLGRRDGRILARWRDDMPGQVGFQFVRERRAVEDGFGDLCFEAISCAMYAHGLGDFSPAVHMPESGIRYVADAAAPALV